MKKKEAIGVALTGVAIIGLYVTGETIGAAVFGMMLGLHLVVTGIIDTKKKQRKGSR